MKPLKYISANTWHPPTIGNRRSPYPLPQTILRQSVGVAEYKFQCETVTTESVRAAVVMPRGVPFEHLLTVPWAMTYTTADWVMIIASVEDQMGWIELARATGCTHYFRSHGKCSVYKWFPPEVDEFGLKIRPKTAMDWEKIMRIERGESPTKGNQYKQYNKARLLDEIRIGETSYPKLAVKYGVSRITVMRIAHDAGIRKLEKKNVKTQATIDT